MTVQELQNAKFYIRQQVAAKDMPGVGIKKGQILIQIAVNFHEPVKKHGIETELNGSGDTLLKPDPSLSFRENIERKIEGIKKHMMAKKNFSELVLVQDNKSLPGFIEW